MNEIRFNPAPAPKPEEAKKEKPKFFSKKAVLRFLFRALPAAAAVLLILLAINFWPNEKGEASGSRESGYYAVFLTDGQVYFGEIESNDGREMKLSGAYRLDTHGQSYQSLSQMPQGATFSLIRLRDELHSPTDELYINSSHILFYEKLRGDSRVLQSIKQNQN